MIYVTQGHERGIGLETYLKSLQIDSTLADTTTLITDKHSLCDTLNSLDCTFEIDSKKNILVGKNINLPLIFIESGSYSQSLQSILTALEMIQKEDILFTLPTSKDQLYYDNQNFAGHTEFLRYFFKDNYLTMSFWGPSHNQALITDHISLAKIPTVITNEYFIKKMRIILRYLDNHTEVQKVYIAGMNPHAGENGILGDEELRLAPLLKQLSAEYKFDISSFLSGDTLHMYSSENSFFIYMFHDQGLARFKTENRLLGINATLGLPFLRASVDHGTAFNLYGKNCADASGCLYALDTLRKLHA